MVHKVCRKSELLSPLSKLFDAIFSLQCETIDGLQRGEVEELQNWATLLASGRLESLQKYVQHSYGSLTVLSVDHVGYFNKTQLCFTRRPICKRCLMTQSGFLRLNVGVFEEFISNSFFLLVVAEQARQVPGAILFRWIEAFWSAEMVWELLRLHVAFHSGSSDWATTTTTSA